MILVDTNVISEPMRREPNPAVVSWLDAQPLATLYLCVVTMAELRFGVASLPAGKRREKLHRNLETRVLPLFSGRILAFDLPETEHYARIMAKARVDSLAIGTADGYLAATAASHGLAVATRDTTPFELAGLEVINPWLESHDPR